MGLFDFFKKKATEEQPQTEEQQEGVLELDGVEVETDAQEADIVLDVEDGQDMNRAVHAVMDEEEIQIDRAGEDILYREEAEEVPAEAEIEITFEDADGEEILTAEDAAEAEAVLDELTEIAGEILAEKPLAEDEVIIRRRIEMATQHVRDKAAKRTAAQPTAKLYLRIPDRSRMEEAMRLVPKGAAIPVYVHIASENATLLAPNEYWAMLNPDITAPIGELGDANVNLVKCQ